MCTAENLVFNSFYGFRRSVDKLSVSPLCNMYLRLNRQTFVIVKYISVNRKAEVNTFV
jgi:hypothetical protein